MEDQRSRDFVIREFQGVIVARFTVRNLTAVADLERITLQLEGMIDAGTRKLVLDFKNVKYVSSAALGLLIAVNKKLADLGGKLVLSHPSAIAELLSVSRTDKLFKIAADPKEAVRLFA